MSNSVRVSWKDEPLQRDLKRAIAVAPKEIMDAVKTSTHDVQREAKINVKSKLNTTRQVGVSHSGSLGGLGQSIGTKFTPAAFRGETGPAAIYGRIHEFGGTIKPVHGQFLSFISTKGSSAGQRIFVRLVVIPARPYMRPAFEDSQPKIRANFVKALKKALQVPGGAN